MNDFLTVQRQLTSVVAPSGHEGSRARMIEEMVRPFVDEVYSDVMGNLYAHKRGKGSKIMVAAHMDTLGFVVDYIDQKGFVKVVPLGGIPIYALLAKRLRFEGGAIGTVMAEPGAEVPKKDIRSIAINHFYVDIGARDKAEAESMVSLREFAVYDIQPTMLNDNVLISSYCDDLMGCAVLIEAIRKNETPLNDMIYVFTVQEEVGCRGAKPAANQIQPDIGVIIEVTGALDVMTNIKEKREPRLGEGPTLDAYDSRTIYDAELLDHISELGNRIGHPCQVKCMSTGGTDASAIREVGKSARLACLCMPTRYIHSQAEMVDLRDVQGVLDILLALAHEPFARNGNKNTDVTTEN